MLERLQKVLAAAGIASRRSSEELITQGRVSVNGDVVTELGTKVDLTVDKVVCDGRVIKPPARYYYILLNKPRGVASTVSDPHASRTVVDLVDLQKKPFLRPVGRLDVDTEGLIMLTDDGDFLYKMTHPKHHVGKTYRAVVRGIPDANGVAQLTNGIALSDGVTQPAKDVRVKKSTREVEGAGRAEVELTIFEGKNRQVRRMFSAIGCPVERLKRIRIGDVRIGDLPSGGWRHLTHKEIAGLLALAEGPTPNSLPQGKGTNQEEMNAGHDPRVQNKEKHRTWQTEKQPSKQPKAPSSPSSSKPKRPSPPATSSSLSKRASTTGLRSTATSKVS